jgi:hypothetical protein
MSLSTWIVDFIAITQHQTTWRYLGLPLVLQPTTIDELGRAVMVATRHL